MTDPDLLDLLEILGDIAEAAAESDPCSAGISLQIAHRKIQSFRSAIRQRMNHSQGEV